MQSLRKMPTSPAEPLRKVILALVGCAPLGSMGQLLIEKIWSDPSYEFLYDYIRGVSEKVHRLQETGTIDLDSILSQPETRPLLNRAFEAAARSVGEQKLKALQAATVHGVFERRYSFDMSTMVFSLLDRLTEGHIQMLRFIHDMQGRWSGGAQIGELMKLGTDSNNDGAGLAQPTMGENGQYYDAHAEYINMLIMEDLLNMGVISIDSTNYELPNNFAAAQSGPRVLSGKGTLLYELIFPEAANATDER